MFPNAKFNAKAAEEKATPETRTQPSGIPSVQPQRTPASEPVQNADEPKKHLSAVELYTKYVVEPLRAAGLDPHEEGERAEAAFGLLVQAATSLVAYGFERMLRNAWAAEKAGATRGTNMEEAVFRLDKSPHQN